MFVEGNRLAQKLLYSLGMTPRRWENIAKYFFDMSKLIMGTAVIMQLVTKEHIDWNEIALGATTGVLFLLVGIMADRRADVHKS